MSQLDERAKEEVDARALRLVSIEEFVVRPSTTWHIQNFIPSQAFVVTFGAPKSGKTFTVTDALMHAAHGMHWRGLVVPKPLRVAFLAGEGRNGLRLRLRVWMSEHGAELKGDFRLLPEALSLPERAGEVVAALQAYKADVVVVDTLNAFFGQGDENSTVDMTRFVASIRYLMDELGCSVLVIHHTGLADSSRARGSGVLRGAADVIVQVARDGGGSGLIAFQVIEGRDIEPWEQPLSLRLRRVETDWADDTGQPLASCIVESDEQPVSLPNRARALSSQQHLVVQVVHDLVAEKRNGSTDVILARAEVAKLAVDRGANRTSVYRNLSQVAPRFGWQLLEPGSLKVRVTP